MRSLVGFTTESSYRFSGAVGVLLGIDKEEELERLVLAYSPRLRAILDAARQRIRSGIDHTDLGHEFDSSPKIYERK